MPEPPETDYTYDPGSQWPDDGDGDGRHAAPEDDTQHPEYAHDHIAEPQDDDNPETDELSELDDDGAVDAGCFTDEDVAAIDFNRPIAAEDTADVMANLSEDGELTQIAEGDD